MKQKQNSLVSDGLENEFRETYNKWKNGDNSAWSNLWVLVANCCRNIAKKHSSGKWIYRIDNEGGTKIEERALDAASRIMKRLRDGNVIPDDQRLYAYCSPWVDYYCFHKTANIKEDREEWPYEERDVAVDILGERIENVEYYKED